MLGLRLPLLSAVVLLAACGIGVNAGTSAQAAIRPEVVVVLEPSGCPGWKTVGLCESFERASRATGVQGRIVQPSLRENLGDFLGLIARQRYALVVIAGLHYEPEVASTAARYPGVGFAVIDASRRDVTGRPGTIQGVVFRTSEAAYLAGWLAGKLEQRRRGPDVVGVVGGVKIPTVEDFEVGFAAGARRAAPGVKVLVDYSDDFLDESRCRALARRQIARGAGTVFNVAGRCGLGTMRAAANAGVWAVGVDSDQAFLGPHVLTSVLKHWEAGFVALLRQVKAGKIRSGVDTTLTMRDGAVGLGTISPKVPRSLLVQLEGVKSQIVAGEITVPSVARQRSSG